MTITGKINNKPIGVFDSGVGGLTVVKELIKQMPHEHIVYFGDTARVPYGPKSVKSIKHFALQDAAFLMTKDVKMIIVACNTVSSNAMPLLTSNFSIPFVDVLKPNAQYAALSTSNNRIGIIGTYATIESGAYERYIEKLNPSARIFSVPTPLLVPIAEEGWSNTNIAEDVLRKYLQPLIAKNIDTLILGCTHYPLFESRIKAITDKSVRIINSARHTASTVHAMLKESEMTAMRKMEGKTDFYLSDIPRNFSDIAKRFLRKSVPHVKRIDIESY